MSIPEDLTDADIALMGDALGVLEGNWLGYATRPSPRLYPHQWSWDAAFVAIGYSHTRPDRAMAELRSLFAGQWSNGMLPHIVFTPGDQDYFPGPGFWRTEVNPYAPRSPRTSGIVQPPLHATATLEILRNDPEGDRAEAFAAELLPRLAAWHWYLRRERVRNDDGLVEIWHPWESGMDNSPLWDEALGRLVPEGVRDWVRADLGQAVAEERPSDEEYERYIHLVQLFRTHRYHPELICRVTPFAIADVLYNTLWVQANRDLAEIAEHLGADATSFLRWADETAAGMRRRLWSEEQASFVDYDLLAEEPIATRVGASFSPLFAGVPTPDQGEVMVTQLCDSVGVQLDPATWMIPSFDPRSEGFRPTNYWRGPIWVNVNWVLYHGLRRYGYRDLARTLRRSLLELPRRSGFYEHYHPRTGEGHGAERFAWTAALVLDLLLEEASDEGAPDG